MTQKQLNDIIPPKQINENPKYNEIKKTILDREESDWNPSSNYSIKNTTKNKNLKNYIDGLIIEIE